MADVSLKKIEEEITEELQHLPPEDLKKVYSYVCFLKLNKSIDPSQLYFWTKKWQQLEFEAESDKHTRKIIGNGTPAGLLKALKDED